MFRSLQLLIICISLPYSVHAQFTVKGVHLEVQNTSMTDLYVNMDMQIDENGVTNGTVDNDATLTVTGNWVNNNSNGTHDVFPPIDRDNVGSVNFVASTQKTIGGSDSTTFESVVINNSYDDATSNLPAVTLDKNINVEYLLTLTDGVINQNGNTFTLGDAAGPTVGTLTDPPVGWTYGGAFKRYYTNGATWSRDAAGAAGLEKSLFPIGSADPGNDLDYRPVRIGATTAPTCGTCLFTVDHVESYPAWNIPVTPFNDVGFGNVEAVSTATWNISTGGDLSAGVFDMAIEFRNMGRGNSADVSMVRLSDAPGTYAAATSITEPTPLEARLNRTGVPFGTIAGTTGAFKVGTKNKTATPLPVELLFFDATLDEDIVDLTWATETEINNDFFTIQRKGPGGDVEDIATIDGAGNSSERLDYSTVDQNPIIGRSYYRIVQTDFNGEKTTYKWHAIYYNPLDNNRREFSAKMYPNPNSGDLINMVIRAEEQEDVLVVMVNSLGQQVYSKVVTTKEGSTYFAIDLEKRLAPGMYIVTGSSENELFNERLIIR